MIHFAAWGVDFFVPRREEKNLTVSYFQTVMYSGPMQIVTRSMTTGDDQTMIESWLSEEFEATRPSK